MRLLFELALFTAAVVFGAKWYLVSKSLKGLLIYTAYKGCKPTDKDLEECLQAIRDGEFPEEDK